MKNKYALNVLAAAAVIVVLMGAFMYWLGGYTRHGQTTPVPDLRGLDADDAIRTVEAMNFRWEIIDSSRYEAGKRPRAVIYQDPSAGASAKGGRKIYLKINRSSWENAVIPFVDFENDKVENVSRRLTAAGFTVGEITYQPHMGNDVVLELSSSGRPVQPGQKLPKMTVIDILAGQQEGETVEEDTLDAGDF